MASRALGVCVQGQSMALGELEPLAPNAVPSPNGDARSAFCGGEMSTGLVSLLAPAQTRRISVSKVQAPLKPGL